MISDQLRRKRVIAPYSALSARMRILSNEKKDNSLNQLRIDRMKKGKRRGENQPRCAQQLFYNAVLLHCIGRFDFLCAASSLRFLIVVVISAFIQLAWEILHEVIRSQLV